MTRAVKVAICIPRFGDTKGDFTISLGRLLVRSLAEDVPMPGGGRARLEVEIFSIASSDLPENRTRLLQQALAWQARYLLWLDDDHVFPPDGLLRLLGHGLAVVGCNYARRTEPSGPVAMRLDAAGKLEPVWTTAELARAGKVEEVAHVGLGFTLMDMAILHQVKAHVEAHGPGWALWSPFDRKLLSGSHLRMGEDASFFHELREAGIAIHVDHGLSWQIGHLGEHMFTNAETVADRQAWLNRLR